MKLPDLFRWQGTVDRGTYTLVGVVGFAIKHNLDRIVASWVFHKEWGIFNYYIPPGQALHVTSLPREEAVFFATMVAISLPFIYVGVGMTLKRLRSAGLPEWLVVLFFAPFLNLLFFLLMAVIPARAEVARALPPHSRLLDRLIPRSALGSATMAVLLVVPLSLGVLLLSTNVFNDYGWGLFVGLPFAIGLAAVLLYGYHAPRGFPGCIGISTLAVALVGVLLMAAAIEGLVCILMAVPLAVPLAWIGGAVGYVMQRRPSHPQPAPATLAMLVLAVPGLMGLEHARPLEPPVFAVESVVEVNAPPAVVWQNVVAFAQLPPPTEWLFRAGVAYPTRAVIYGSGPGAVRHCQFSTGAFVEPIEIWDAPRRLAFRVTAQPAPMEEWTPYEQVDPAHLHGFLEVQRGEFHLIELPGGRTRLEGTTWYRHRVWPASYWKQWADFAIHRIHLRVLRHIQRLSEEKAVANIPKRSLP
ncbi:MAG TPA: hypothetical protein VNK82_02370 [Terriglobales bacterium]|nr:hypothetical protein [Terriglobales bacterium]